ncbi:MAG: lipoyl(octanoyl) transferase LipB [Bacillota bacterium]
MSIHVEKFKNADYKKILNLQFDLLNKRQNNKIEDTLLILDHKPVITLGRNADKKNLLYSKEQLKKENIDLVDIKRGGDITYHGPGQIVGYTIFNIRQKNYGIKKFVYKLEQVFIDLLKNEYKIKAKRDKKHRGVWIKNKKIVAIGLSVKRGVTMHGFAFNVNTNLDYFDFIIPCGIKNKGVTSLEKIANKEINFEKVKKLVKKYMLDEFDCS